ncbi:MAG: S1 family peptidase [Thainema sp.]
MRSFYYYESLLGVGLLFTTLTGCSAVGKTQGRRAQIATDPKDALVYITYRRDKDGHGTGFLIENKESDSCLVVTNAHVTGNHQDVRITTGKDTHLHHAESVRQFPDLDLAVVSFATDTGVCPYPVLKLGNANQLKDGDEVRVIGYPARSDNLPLVSKPQEGKVTAIKSPQAFGYGISYNAPTYQGMSGAPVLVIAQLG